LGEKIGIEAPLNKKVVEMVHTVEKRGEFFESEEILDELRR